MRNLKILLVAVMVLGLAGIAYAVNPDTMNLLVTPETTISVNIYKAEYNFGSVALGNAKTVNTPDSIRVVNDGDAGAYWNDQAGNSTNWSLGTGGTPGEDTFVLLSSCVATTEGQPTHAQITHELGTGYGISISTVNSGVERCLYFKLIMPSTVSAGKGGQQTILYTINATQAGT